MHPIVWLALFAILCAIAYFWDYPLCLACYDELGGNTRGITGALSFGIALTVVSVLTTGIVAGVLIADFTRHDYWIFMDKFDREHCDTVEPNYNAGVYYWQPLGNDIPSLPPGQTLSADYFVIASCIIHWRVGGFRRSRGEIIKRDGSGIEKDLTISRLLLSPRNSRIWQNAYITVQNQHDASVTGHLRAFLKLTAAEPNLCFSASLPNLLYDFAHLLSNASKRQTVLNDYYRMGVFVAQMRELAAKWPQNSDYARAIRGESDIFLDTMPTEDVAEWRKRAALYDTDAVAKRYIKKRTENSEVPTPAPDAEPPTVTPTSKSQPEELHPGPGDCIRVSMEEINRVKASLAAKPGQLPEKHPGPGDAVCYSAEEVAKMKAAEPAKT